MIEKLKPAIKGFDDKPQMPTATEFLDKINEIIDELNPILEEREYDIKVYEEVMSNMKQDNRMIGSVTFDKIEGKMNPEPTDQFTEERESDINVYEEVMPNIKPDKEIDKLKQELIKTKQALDVAMECIHWIDETYEMDLELEADIQAKCEYTMYQIKQITETKE